MQTLLAPATLLAALLLAPSAAAQDLQAGEGPEPAPNDGAIFGPTPGGSSSSSKAGLIAGLIVAVCLLLAVVLAGAVYFYRVRKAPPAAAGMVSNGQDKVPVPGDGGWDKRPSGPPQDASSLDKRAAPDV